MDNTSTSATSTLTALFIGPTSCLPSSFFSENLTLLEWEIIPCIQACAKLNAIFSTPPLVIVYYPKDDDDFDKNLKSFLSTSKIPSSTYQILYNPSLNNIRNRLSFFQAGIQMIAPSPKSILQGINALIEQLHHSGPFTCPVCHFPNINENGLHFHVPLYHSMQSNIPPLLHCPICKKHRHDFSVHLHNHHGELSNREPSRPSFPAFSWVIVKQKQQQYYLLVNEPAEKCNGTPKYWFPAGRVDANETFVEAGIRETLEEAGVKVHIKGVIQFRLESNITPRIVLYAEPEEEDAVPKFIPDFESCGAVWVSSRDILQNGIITKKDCRSSDPIHMIQKLEQGGLKYQSLETGPFRELEGMVKLMTSLSTFGEVIEVQPRFLRVWRKLKDTYPSFCFVED